MSSTQDTNSSLPVGNSNSHYISFVHGLTLPFTPCHQSAWRLMKHCRRTSPMYLFQKQEVQYLHFRSDPLPKEYQKVKCKFLHTFLKNTNIPAKWQKTNPSGKDCSFYSAVGKVRQGKFFFYSSIQTQGNWKCFTGA